MVVATHSAVGGAEPCDARLRCPADQARGSPARLRAFSAWLLFLRWPELELELELAEALLQPPAAADTAAATVATAAATPAAAPFGGGVRMHKVAGATPRVSAGGTGTRPCRFSGGGVGFSNPVPVDATVDLAPRTERTCRLRELVPWTAMCRPLTAGCCPGAMAQEVRPGAGRGQ
jgi:hypothetical protein